MSASVKTYLQRVTDAYMEACDFTETTMFEEQAGEFGGEFHGFSQDMYPKAEEDCADFLSSITEAGLFIEMFNALTPEQIGHDFWFTRNGHGCGFWDRGLGELGEKLTEWSKPYGEADVYVGDDGWAHFA